MPTKQVLFKIYDGDREYVIYTNGETEGFGEGAMVVNYYQALLYSFLSAKGIVVDDSALTSPPDSAKSSLAGDGHSVPA